MVRRWCNSKYKLDGKKQQEEWLRSLGYYSVQYIGLCADEERRFRQNDLTKGVVRYPLAEEGILEDTIIEWAKHQPIFNHYYESQRRCGCMYCPMSSFINFAYLYKYYPDNFTYMIEKMREAEEMVSKKTGRPFSIISSNPKYNADYLVHIVESKWLKRLEEKEQELIKNKI